MDMHGSEMPPTAAQLRVCGQREAAYTGLMAKAKWAALKAKVNGLGVPAGRGDDDVFPHCLYRIAVYS